MLEYLIDDLLYEVIQQAHCFSKAGRGCVLY